MSLNFQQEAERLRETLIARRRDFHRHPELAFQEVRTAGIVAETLTALGLEVQTGIGQTGVVALLEGDQDGPTLLIRADMDALPIHEKNEVDYNSQTANVMHACGHDGHTSIGLAVAEMLYRQRARIKGRVKFVFQPAEECGSGAAAMIKDGALDNPRPDFSIGLHLWNTLPVGEISVTPGPAMAAADIFTCTITGYGGHGASPHETQDPIVATAQIISALQTITSRNVAPLDSAVVTVGSIHGGEAFNVIPPDVKIEGTIRTFLKPTQALVHRRIKEICEGVAASLGCQAELTIKPMTIAVVNDGAICQTVIAAAEKYLSPDKIHQNVRTMGAEDMSLFMDDIPGCYFLVGSANTEKGLDYPHHNPRFDIDEDSLVLGAAVMAEAAARLVIGY